MSHQVRAALAAGALLLLGACSGNLPMAQSAPSATRPSNPMQDTGSMALPTANSQAGRVSTTTVR